ncbi:MAG: NAD-dependent epimerase/dehydratase family protein [Bacteriovoracaceae bacterium]
MSKKKIKNVLIIGIAGGLAKITATLLTKSHPDIKIIGIDSRRLDFQPSSPNITLIQAKYTRTNFENIFREHEFDTVIHLGRTSHTSSNPLGSLAKRLDLNVIGTQRILDLCLKYEVKRVLILSTFHVYGAFADNPIFLKEDAQLRADFKHPEIRDVVEMDQVSSNWMWKNQDLIKTVILRPCNIIGPSINNAITTYLTSSISPVPLDYNPMFQFLHEFDIANLIVSGINKMKTGIYNVAPNDYISIRDAKKLVGKGGIPMSVFLLENAAQFLKKAWLDGPNYLIDYIKYPCLLDNSALKQMCPEFRFRFDSKDALGFLKD